MCFVGILHIIKSNKFQSCLLFCLNRRILEGVMLTFLGLASCQPVMVDSISLQAGHFCGMPANLCPPKPIAMGFTFYRLCMFGTLPVFHNTFSSRFGAPHYSHGGTGIVLPAQMD